MQLCLIPQLIEDDAPQSEVGLLAHFVLSGSGVVQFQLGWSRKPVQDAPRVLDQYEALTTLNVPSEVAAKLAAAVRLRKPVRLDLQIPGDEDHPFAKTVAEEVRKLAGKEPRSINEEPVPAETLTTEVEA